MLPIRNAALSARTQQKLDEYQSAIDAIADYAERVAAAKAEFESKNRAGSAVFKEVRDVLESLCTGTARCMYCEDAPPNQIEHIRPKSLYPEAVFSWANYLYACSPCNLGKLNKFEVYATRTGQRVNVARSSRSPVVPPEEGEPLLINPRTEDPLTFLTLDIRDTFYFQPRTHLNDIARERAEYTLDTLGLNSRQNLRDSREHAYDHYCLILEKYVQDKGRSSDNWPRFQRSIRRTNHATVWAEMKRQYLEIADLKALFEQAPEALEW